MKEWWGKVVIYLQRIRMFIDICNDQTHTDRSFTLWHVLDFGCTVHLVVSIHRHTYQGTYGSVSQKLCVRQVKNQDFSEQILASMKTSVFSMLPIQKVQAVNKFETEVIFKSQQNSKNHALQYIGAKSHGNERLIFSNRSVATATTSPLANDIGTHFTFLHCSCMPSLLCGKKGHHKVRVTAICLPIELLGRYCNTEC